MILRCYSPVDSHSLKGGVSGGHMICDDVVALKTNGICACVHVCFYILIKNTANIKEYNLHR